jgi:acetoin utilization protein AcuB
MKHREPVSHIMSKDVKTVHQKQNLAEVQQLMDEFKIRHIPVLDGNKVIGILSRTDIMNARYGAIKGGEELQTTLLTQMSVEKAMTPNPQTVSSGMSIREVGGIFHEKTFSALPVIEDEKLVGIVTTKDVIGYLLEQY